MASCWVSFLDHTKSYLLPPGVKKRHRIQFAIKSQKNKRYNEQQTHKPAHFQTA
jgi:hypothetical protein